jgi:HEAT repeat protein
MIAPVSQPAPLPSLPVDVQYLLSDWAMASPAARQTLLQRVAAYGQPGLHLLVQSFQHPDPAIRLAAVSAVGSLGDPTCLPAVQNLLNDPDPNVIQVAHWAISILQNR